MRLRDNGLVDDARLDKALVDLLRQRDGASTTVIFKDDRRLEVRNVACGYDEGDEYAHISTNVSPQVTGVPFDFFFTSEVQTVLDPGTGARLWEAT
jgi:hypothetical protein